MACNGSLAAGGVSFDYRTRAALRHVSLVLQTGMSLALAGPNGSGKTTLLRLLAGSLPPSEGEVTLLNRPLGRWPGRDRARLVAVVPQDVDPTLALPVESVVALGRTPHTGFLGALSAADRDSIARALHATDAGALRGRRFNELSGGERRRVMLATALAQSPRFLLLDEPTVHLDLEHQYALLQLLRRLSRERGIGVLAVVHDLNLAALYFDRIAILVDGTLAAEGTPEDVLSRADLGVLFRAPLRVVRHPDRGQPQVLLQPADW